MKYKFDADHFISPKTPEAAYILGLLWADGNLDGKYRVQIKASFFDLSSVKRFFEATGNWTYRIQQREKQSWKDTLVIRASSKSLVSFLSENDYTAKSHKSADKILSLIPDNLKHYWFRGLMDGDGSFYLQSNCNSKTGSRKSCISCFSSYEQDWTFFTSLLDNLKVKYKLNRRIRIKENKEQKSSSLEIYGKDDILNFGNYLYQNYPEDNIGFDRKYQNFLAIKSHVSTLLPRGKYLRY
jgi:hypothetical protein